MRRIAAACALAACCVAIAACGSDSEPEATTTTEPTATTSTTTMSPEGPGGRIETGDGRGGVALEEIGTFDQPVYVAQPGGDDEHLYVVEQCGRILRVPYEGGESEVFLDISDEVACGGEQGLLSVAFAPGYPSPARFYVYFTDTEGTARVVEYEPEGDGFERANEGSARELLAIEDFAANHNGGQLQFGPDGFLYIGTGDGGGAGDPERTAQDLGSLLGKILRIDPRPGQELPYSIPKDNPQLEDPNARPEILVHGLRNPWRFSFDRAEGDLWIGDVGQDAFEEIDAAAPDEITGLDSGLNFGWSAFEGTERFNEDQEAPGANPPVFEYANDDENCSVTGGYVVRDPSLPTLFGRYLYGDFCAGELRSFTARRDPRSPSSGEVTDDRELGIEVPSLSSFGEDSFGHLYAVSLDGAVSRLVAQ